MVALISGILSKVNTCPCITRSCAKPILTDITEIRNSIIVKKNPFMAIILSIKNKV
jgi:hypothetical protein